MVVLKFGGSSVRDAEWIRRVLAIARERLSEAPLLVSSAMGKTTDRLVAIGQMAERGDADGARDETDRIASEHRRNLNDLTGELEQQAALAWQHRLDELTNELATLVDGLVLVRELSERTADALLSFGERLATLVLGAAAECAGIDATVLDSRALIRTDDRHQRAMPDLQTTGDLIRAHVDPRPNHLYIAQGFVGQNSSGATTTLGRGGSDFSATIYGAALGAERVEIWTDVDGIMTADPRAIPGATTIPEVSYGEAAELAYFGARVIHPATMLPAVEQAIPVLVCNTGNPHGPVTRIVAQPSRPGLRALASRAGVTIITVHSSRMLNAWGYLGRVFAMFEQHQVSVDLVATSEVSVSVSIDLPQPPSALIEELSQLGSVSVDADRAVLSLVGEAVWRDSALVRDVFAVFAEIGQAVEMISLGSSDTNLSVVLPAAALAQTIQALHRRLFE